jgi:Gram-negative porin
LLFTPAGRQGDGMQNLYARPAAAPFALVLTALASTALALFGTSARAADVTVSGFGTAGFVITDTDDAEYIRSGQGTGADDSGSVGVDSIAGLQSTIRLNDRVSGTAQVLFRRRTGVDFDLDVPLAFIKFDVTKTLATRMGRVPLPVFMVSDFRQVGYANTWIRPPDEVYGQVPVDSVDGLDLLYNGSAGSVSFTTQGFYGRLDTAQNGITIKVKKFRGINVSATMGPLTLRVGRVDDELSLVNYAPVDQLIAAIRAIGFNDLADELAPTDQSSSFTGLGASLDWNNVIVQTEYTKSKVGGFPADTRGVYGLVGYRFGKFTPYAIYADRTVTSARTSNVIPRVGPLLPIALGVDALIAGTEQNTTSAGLRWDVADSVALKFQFDHVDPEGPGLFANTQPDFDGPVNVVGIAVDVLF